MYLSLLLTTIASLGFGCMMFFWSRRTIVTKDQHDEVKKHIREIEHHRLLHSKHVGDVDCIINHQPGDIITLDQPFGVTTMSHQPHQSTFMNHFDTAQSTMMNIMYFKWFVGSKFGKCIIFLFLVLLSLVGYLSYQLYGASSDVWINPTVMQNTYAVCMDRKTDSPETCADVAQRVSRCSAGAPLCQQVQ